MGGTIKVSTFLISSNPYGARIWMPPSAVTGPLVVPHTKRWYLATPSVVVPALAKTSEAMPRSNGVTPS